MGRRSQVKGAQYERELAKRWREQELFRNAKRGLGQARGDSGNDIEGTPYWVQAKQGKAIGLREAMRQAIRDTDGRTPIVVARYDGDSADDALVVMRLADWERLESSANVLETIPVH